MSFLEMIIKIFCLFEDRKILLPFQRTKTSINIGSQSQKGILPTNFAKTTHFEFYSTSIISNSKFEKSLRFN